MVTRTLQLILHYDGTQFAGWQVQPDRRTVQGVLETEMERLCGTPVRVTGAGRTDAGVHARGQAAGLTVPEHFSADRLRQILNGRLPSDVWVEMAYEMDAAFHPRFSATARRYSYAVGLDEGAGSPFRRRFEFPFARALDREALAWCAEQLMGTHRFIGFAVKGTAPETDDHRCTVHLARWREGAHPGGLVFDIAANRFLHHQVRFLVGTMLAVGAGLRDRTEFTALLVADRNDDVSPPAPPTGLCLEQVTYPDDLYLTR